MRRIALRTGPTALFGAFLLAALLVFLPLRLVLGVAGLGEAGLTARAVRGTIWGGSLVEARFGDLSLGDLRAHLQPLPLLIGRARIELDGRAGDGPRPLHGAISVSRHLIGVDDLSATLPTGRVFAPVPVSMLDVDALTVHFRDGACEQAEGRVRATLSGDVGGIALPAAVAGNARCDGAALLLPLASSAGTESIALRITAAGSYRGELSLQPQDPAMIAKLEAAGFVSGPGGGYRLVIEGRF